MTTSVQDTNPVAHTLDKIQNICDKDVIFLLGKTRAGKSTFINDTAGEHVLASTASMTSDTVAISYVQVSFDDNRVVNLVDTIGFGGSHVEHTRPDLAAKYISILRSSENQTTIKVFLYLIDINDGAGLDHENEKNLNFLAALVGEGVFSNVVFVTTKWGSPADEDGREVQEDRHCKWESKLLVKFPGSRLIRLDAHTSRRSPKRLEADPVLAAVEKVKYRDNALNVIRFALERPAKQPTQLEQELNGSGGTDMTIGDTSLGQLVTQQVQEEAQSLALSNPDVANAILQHEAFIRSIPVNDQHLVEKLGDLAYRYGKVVMEVASTFVPGTGRNTIMEKFSEGVERTVHQTTYAAERGGTIGGLVAAATGAIDTFVTSMQAARP
ncbi:G domain-containing protein [Mycena sanguinolenta]|uniref:G domain-containing protein n=1 Tax=Mycena sanguinolenta TaxID=230812 RepID=A0A8H6Y222_9AGAR|nr:G domain-containing protein [Mycena sanguinolenta]